MHKFCILSIAIVSESAQNRNPSPTWIVRMVRIKLKPEKVGAGVLLTL
jgi:hypothetical protein